MLNSRSIALHGVPIIVTWFFVCVQVLAQSTLYVDDDTCPAVGDGSFGNPYCSIQDAINASVDGDEIVVQPGTYIGLIDMQNRKVYLHSAAGAAATILDGAGLGPVITCDQAENANTMIEGFTITGGTGNATVFGSLSGGGLFNNNGSPTIIECIFISNTAESGGAVFNYFSNATFTRCMFTGNSANSVGGAIFNWTSFITVESCLFVSNSAVQYGGAIHNLNTVGATIQQCTFALNSAGISGAALYSGFETTADLSNSILHGNFPNEIGEYTFGSVTLNFCSIRGGWFGSGANNTSAAPDFESELGIDGLPGTGDEDLRLKRYSPAIDAGDNSLVPVSVSIDYDGNPRFVDDAGVADTGLGVAPIVDLGAYERQIDSAPREIHVPADYATIEEACDAAIAGDEIVVSPGTYYENLFITQKVVTIRSIDPTNPSMVASTIIDGSAGAPLPTFWFQTAATSGSLLDGLTITGANSGTAGGAYLRDCDITVSRCVISGNEGVNGGGLQLVNSDSEILDCTFDSNIALYRGGGIHIYQSDPLIERCRFVGNTCTYTGSFAQGGGINCRMNSAPIINDCIFDGNSAYWSGGGFHVDSAGAPALTNCLFVNNSAGVATFGGGGAADFTDGNSIFTNCTFANNTASVAGGLYNQATSTLTLTNCIVWGNSPGGIVDEIGAATTVTYSNTQSLRPGSGNLSADPFFVDAASSNMRLAGLSPCVDSGNNLGLPAGLTVDLDGNPRFRDDVGVPDTGVGSAPIIDMGAYERQLTSADCNGNGVDDQQDINSGTSLDLNENFVPDECEPCFSREITALSAPDGFTGDGYGLSVDIDGSLAIIGSPYDDPLAADSGSAYVYRWLPSIKRWVFEQKLAPADGQAGDAFGTGVAVADLVSTQNDWIVVSATGDDDKGSNSGSLYAFQYDGLNWVERDKFVATDGTSGDGLGFPTSIDASGSIIVAGAYSDDPNGISSGSAYVFRRSGTIWNQETKLVPTDNQAGDFFGFGVDIDIDTIVVGAAGDDDLGAEAGSAYIYNYTGGAWIQGPKITPPQISAGDYFGIATGIYGDAVIIGAYLDDFTGVDSGSAYIYRWNGASWIQEQKLQPADLAAADLFGTSVDIADGIAVVGSSFASDNNEIFSGSAYIFGYNAGTMSWDELVKVKSLEAGFQSIFGYATAIDGHSAIVGAPNDDTFGTDAGNAYLYHGLSDCNGNLEVELCELAQDLPLGPGCEHIPDQYVSFAYDGDLDTGETIVLNPTGGSMPPPNETAIEITNVSGPYDSWIFVTESSGTLFPGAGGYGVFDGKLIVDTSLNDGEFFMTIAIIFMDADLGGADPTLVDLTYYNSVTSAWELAVAGNTQNSPGFPGAVGDRFVDVDTPIPVLSNDLGDYGVYWNTTLLQGFVWANVDHTTAFAPGLAPACPADTNGSGDVNVTDLLALLAAWGSNPGHAADINDDGNVNVTDLLALLAAWGACP